MLLVFVKSEVNPYCILLIPSAVSLDLAKLVLEGEAGALAVTVGVGGGGLHTCQAQAGGGGQDQEENKGGEQDCFHC